MLAVVTTAGWVCAGCYTEQRSEHEVSPPAPQCVSVCVSVCKVCVSVSVGQIQPRVTHIPTAGVHSTEQLDRQQQ